jgi:hypothetical protein
MTPGHIGDTSPRLRIGHRVDRVAGCRGRQSRLGSVRTSSARRLGAENPKTSPAVTLGSLDLFQDERIFDLVVASEEQDFGHDFGCFGVVVGEGQEQSSAMLSVNGNDAD